MRRIITFLSAALLLVPSGLVIAAAQKKTATHKKTSASKTSKTSKKKGKKKSSQSWRTRQLQPTPERYREIQQALVTKGYLKTQPTGTWDTESADALRHFQQDQSLQPTGKIDSLSLIALGLGPKYDNTASR